VHRLHRHGPAHQSGEIKPLDQLICVNGIDIQLVAEESVSSLLRGEAGSEALLIFVRNGRQRNVKLVRQRERDFLVETHSVDCCSDGDTETLSDDSDGDNTADYEHPICARSTIAEGQHKSDCNRLSGTQSDDARSAGSTAEEARASDTPAEDPNSSQLSLHDSKAEEGKPAQSSEARNRGVAEEGYRAVSESDLVEIVVGKLKRKHERAAAAQRRARALLASSVGEGRRFLVA